MSYILEALKKADQERDLGAVPNLATPHEIKRPQTHSYRWLWLVVALLIVNVGLVVALLNKRSAEAPVTALTPLEERPSLINDQSAQATRHSKGMATSEAPTPEKKILAENARVLSAGELVVLPEPESSQNSKPASVREEGLDRRMGAMPTTKDVSQLQSWHELPLEFRNSLDLPHLDLHAYSDAPQNRFILVNLKKYREGETLESGLLLEEILPDGMVMSYRGERFLVEK